MTAPSIRREITRDTKGGAIRYVNSWCRACTYWNAFAFTLDAAFDQGERHLMNVHDVDARTATNARRQHDAKTTNREVCTCPSGDGSLRWPCPIHTPTDREICGAVLNADSRPCQSERGHSGDHWTPSDQADKPMWWSDTDRENGSAER